MANDERSSRRWSHAWLMMAGALTVHVADEARNDFLSLYNPNAQGIRERFGIPIPIFTFESWISSLAVAILLVALASAGARRGARWLILPSYALAGLMALNGLAHIASSVVMGRFMPGVFSSPLLLAASWLLARRTRALPARAEMRYT